MFAIGETNRDGLPYRLAKEGQQGGLGSGCSAGASSETAAKGEKAGYPAFNGLTEAKFTRNHFETSRERRTSHSIDRNARRLSCRHFLDKTT